MTNKLRAHKNSLSKIFDKCKWFAYTIHMTTLLKLILLISITFGVAGCITTQTQEVKRSTLNVATSFYVLEHFSQHVGGDHITIVNTIPSGIDGHHYTPSPKDIADLYNADLFIYNGNGFDLWAEEIAQNLENEGVYTLNITDQLDLLESEDGSAYDPHVWLDPQLAIKEVQELANLFSSLDPANTTEYQENAVAYQTQLEQLDREFTETLAHCELNSIIAAHDAYNYLAQRYDFTVLPIAGISPDSRPSAKRIAELVTLAQDNSIHYIMFEELASAELSTTLAEEVGAETLILNPLEGLTSEQVDKDETYITMMRANLNNLSLAMNCAN